MCLGAGRRAYTFHGRRKTVNNNNAYYDNMYMSKRPGLSPPPVRYEKREDVKKGKKKTKTRTNESAR